MTIHEFIAKFTAEQIHFQPLADCLTNIQARKGGLSAVTFLTNATTATNVVQNTGKVGMILWLDREPWEKAFEQSETQETLKETP
jgi:hypothetical protein